MSLLFPAYLLGMLGLALPWLLHRFSDQQPEEQLFPSRQFLEPTTPPVSRKRKLRYRVLFAFRLLSLLLLTVLFAQPWISRDSAGDMNSMHHVLAVDQSFSMRAESRWENALRISREIVNGLAPGESVELVGFANNITLVTGGGEDSALNKGEVLAALMTIKPGFTAADYGVLMRRMDSLASEQEKPVKVWVVSDLQKSGLPDRLNTLYAPRVRALSIHPVNVDPQRNYRLDALAQTLDDVFMRITATVTSSISEVEDSALQTDEQILTVIVSFNEQELARREVMLSPGEVETIVFEDITLPAVADPIVTVRIAETDALSEDDELRLPLKRSAPTPVAMLQANASVSRSAAVFLATALETDGSAIVRLVAGTAERLPPETRHIVTGRVLDGKALDLDVLQFVDSGGNALVFNGGAEPTSVSRLTQGVDVGLVDDAHPLALGEIDWFGTQFYELAPMTLQDKDRVLLETSDRRPVLVERPAPRGSLLILNDRLDGMGSNLPLQPAFVSLVQSILRYFDANSAIPDQVIAGDRIAFPANIQILNPDDRPLLELNESNRSGGIQLTEPGLYTVIATRGESKLNVVTDPQESDLSMLSAMTVDAWQQRYSESGRSGNSSELQSATISTANGGRAEATLSDTAYDKSVALWRWILPFLVLALALESWSGNRRLDVRRDGS